MKICAFPMFSGISGAQREGNKHIKAPQRKAITLSD